MKTFINLLLIVFVFNVSNAQKKKLSLNLKTGETYMQVSNAKMTMTQDIEGQEYKSALVLNGKMSYKVISIDKDIYNMSVQFESLSMKMDLPTGIIEFSSEKVDEQDIFSQILAKLIKNSFEIKMSKYGKVEEVSKIESIFESLFEDFDYIPENQIIQLKKQINDSYGAEALKGSIEMTTAIFPNKRVKQGETWTVKTNLKSVGSSLITSIYTLDSFNKNYITISGNSIIEDTNDKTFTEINDMSMRNEMNGKMVSTIKIDNETGWIIEAKISQEMNGNIIFKQSSNFPDGMTFPMTMKNEMVYTNK